MPLAHPPAPVPCRDTAVAATGIGSEVLVSCAALAGLVLPVVSLILDAFASKCMHLSATLFAELHRVFWSAGAAGFVAGSAGAARFVAQRREPHREKKVSTTWLLSWRQREKKVSTTWLLSWRQRARETTRKRSRRPGAALVEAARAGLGPEAGGSRGIR